VLLEREGWQLNVKRVYRIYVEEQLIVRRRLKRRRAGAQARVPVAAPRGADQVWTMDLLHDALACGRKLRTLAIEDACTREMLAIEVATSLPALRVIRVLEQLRTERGLPEKIIVNNGAEFTSKALDQWAYKNQLRLHFITPGRPMENGYLESFHGKFREECLNEHWFLTLEDARETIESWRLDYNQMRPHSSLGYRTPDEFARSTSTTNHCGWLCYAAQPRTENFLAIRGLTEGGSSPDRVVLRPSVRSYFREPHN
jgi:putative transposase